jgi:uncharacterized protein (TIGR01777 family)
MAVVCREWEEAAAPAESLGLRLATIRTGIVLAKGEGALGAMGPIFRALPLAAPIGNGHSPFYATGRQWMSWVHIDDIAGIFLLALDHADARGPINGTAPNPVRNVEFAAALSKALWGRASLPIPFGPPDLLLQLLQGEVAQVVTKGQKVLPEKALKLGYAFRYPELMPALRAVFAKAPAPPRQEAESRPATAGHH